MAMNARHLTGAGTMFFSTNSYCDFPDPHEFYGKNIRFPGVDHQNRGNLHVHLGWDIRLATFGTVGAEGVLAFS